MSKASKKSNWFATVESSEEDSEEYTSSEEEVKPTAKTTTKAPVKPQPAKSTKATPSTSAKSAKWMKNAQSSSEEDSDEDESSEEEVVKQPVKKPAAAAKPAGKPSNAAKWMKGAQVSDSDSEEEESSEEDVKPAAKKPVAKKPAANAAKWMKGAQKSSSESEDESDEEESSEEDTKAKKPAAAKSTEDKAAKWMKKPGQESSDSESDDEGFLDSDESEEEKGAQKKSRFEDSDEEEDEKRVAKSAKERKHTEITNAANKLKNATKKNDWPLALTEFEALNKTLEKTMKVFKEVPNEYVEALIALDEDITKTTADKAIKKKLNTTASRALNALKQRVKKVLSTHQKQVDEIQGVAVASPVAVKPVAGKKVTAADVEFDTPQRTEEPEDEEWEEVTTVVKKKQPQAQKPAPAAQKQAQAPAQKAKATPAPAAPTTAAAKKAAAAAAAQALSMEALDKQLSDLLSNRGKKNTDKMEQIEQLSKLIPAAPTPAKTIEVLIHVISAMFDVNPSTGTTYLPIDIWKRSYEHLMTILTLLAEKKNIELVEADFSGAPATTTTITTSENLDVAKIATNFVMLFERLDDEWICSLQCIDPHTHAYLTRLQDEALLLSLAEQLFNYYERRTQPKNVAKIAIRIFEHLYFRRQEDHEKMVARNESKADQSASKGFSKRVITADLTSLLQRLANLIYKYGDDRAKTKAVLCHVYHHALHNRYHQARDLLLMSHLQDTIQHTEPSAQIIFNRAMCQLGLCAFRKGLITDAHSCLADICSQQRTRELLAQGLTALKHGQERKPEQEKFERSKMVPYHMHINIDMLDAVHLISAMLLEAANIAANAYYPKRKVISRTFHRLIESYDRIFMGPPETTKDHVNAAYRELAKGNWKECYEILARLDMWNLLPGGTASTNAVKAQLKEKIQTEALRTYLLTFSKFYDTVDLKMLSETFALPVNQVHSIVSKMIFNEELQGSFDQPSGSLVMHKTEPTKLQYLAMYFSEKSANAVEFYERILETRSGGGQGQSQQKGKQSGGGMLSSGLGARQYPQQQQMGQTGARRHNFQQKQFGSLY